MPVPPEEPTEPGSAGLDVPADPEQVAEATELAASASGVMVNNVSTMAAWQDAVVRDVREMVIRDRSRPSLIIWGTRLNECKDFPGLRAATRQAARELDSTRASSGAMAIHEDRPWIRSQRGQPGAITLTASHPLLGQAEVQVRSVAAKNTSELG